MRHFFIVVNVFIVRAKFGCLIVKSTKNSRVAGARTTGEKRHEKQQCRRKKKNSDIFLVYRQQEGEELSCTTLSMYLSHFAAMICTNSYANQLKFGYCSLYLNTVRLKLLDGTTFIFTYTKSSNSWGQARRLGGVGIRWIDSCNFRASVNWKKNISETKKNYAWFGNEFSFSIYTRCYYKV